MKANWLMLLLVVNVIQGISRGEAAVKLVQSDRTGEFIFIENNIDNSFFVTTRSETYPVMGGANRWSSNLLAADQKILGYIASRDSWVSSSLAMTDMWLEESPVLSPLLGLPCNIGSSGCNSSTSTIPGAVTDAKGYYGIKYSRNDGRMLRIGGTMSDPFYLYLQQMPVGSNFSMKINECSSTNSYNVTAGERCSGKGWRWIETNFTYTKGAHLTLIKTGNVDDVLINTDGVPEPGEGNVNCHTQTIGSKSGLACKVVSYNLQTNGLSNSLIRFHPVFKSSIYGDVYWSDMYFSLDKVTWKQASRAESTTYYTFDEMKESNSIYVFFADGFFKKMLNSGIRDINSRELFYFKIINNLIQETATSPGGGKIYDFSTSNTIMIKPREFSLSITSDEGSSALSNEGRVGSGEPSLDFNYIVTTTGKTAADIVLIKVKGPTIAIDGRSYCIFSSSDNSIKVPFPATLEFTTRDGMPKIYDVGCDNDWRVMSDALWVSSAWNDPFGSTGVMNKTRVKFSILMNEAISRKKLTSLEDWYGDVSASGEVYVQAIWRDVN